MQHDTETYNLLHENLAFAIPATSDGGIENKEDGTVPSFPRKKEERFHVVKVQNSCNETTSQT